MTSGAALDCIRPRFATAACASFVIRSLRFFTSLFTVYCLLDRFLLGFSCVVNVLDIVVHVFNSHLQDSLCQCVSNPHSAWVTSVTLAFIEESFERIGQ